jgi:dephospho-CoA kinase
LSISSKENKEPILVGLTGGIGSGKSTIAKIFETLSVPIFNSDKEAKNIINNNSDVVNAIKKEFGEVYKDGELNSELVANIVFSDKAALEKLNAIIHPKVGEAFNKWISLHSEASILIKEAAILIESGVYKELDKIILVTSPEEVRIKRVMSRDSISAAKVKERIGKQMSDDEKRDYADFVIDNDDNALIIPQVLAIYQKIKKPR